MFKNKRLKTDRFFWKFKCKVIKYHNIIQSQNNFLWAFRKLKFLVKKKPSVQNGKNIVYTCHAPPVVCAFCSTDGFRIGKRICFTIHNNIICRQVGTEMYNINIHIDTIRAQLSDPKRCVVKTYVTRNHVTIKGLGLTARAQT